MMEVRRIFERAKDKLAAVVYDDEEDELSRLIDLWQNVEYLRDFFIEFQKDLKTHDITTTPSKAAQRTRREAKEFFKTLLKLSEQDDSNLNELFYPLDNDERDKARYELQMHKAKGGEYKSWLRIYAIKYGDTFVITGGAIKLTNRMEDRPHTKHELYKLQLVKEYLELGDVEFVYLDI